MSCFTRNHIPTFYDPKQWFPNCGPLTSSTQWHLRTWHKHLVKAHILGTPLNKLNQKVQGWGQASGAFTGVRGRRCAPKVWLGPGEGRNLQGKSSVSTKEKSEAHSYSHWFCSPIWQISHRCKRCYRNKTGLGQQFKATSKDDKDLDKCLPSVTPLLASFCHPPISSPLPLFHLWQIPSKSHVLKAMQLITTAFFIMTF